MSFKWFEDGIETTKVEIGDGAWIEFKNFITVGDELAVASSGLRSLRRPSESDAPDATSMDVIIEGDRQRFVRVLKWATGWNAQRYNAKAKRMEPVALSEAALRVLSTSTFYTIEKKLDEHIAAMSAGKADGSIDGEPSLASASTSESATPNTSALPSN